MPTDQPLNLDRIRAGAAGLTIGRDLRYFPSVDSTNTLARELPPGAWQTGTAIIADYQRTGRGRSGRSWTAPPRSSLLMSILFERDARVRPSEVVMMAALAVCAALAEITSLRTELKWPNDVLLRGRKVCGILAESTSEGGGRVIVGIGLNVNFDPSAHAAIPPSATSVQQELGCRVDREALAVALLRALDIWYGCLTEDPDAVFAAWASRLDTLGSPLLVSDATGTWSGTAAAVTRDGGLVIRDDKGTTRTVYAADVSVRYPPGFTSS